MVDRANNKRPFNSRRPAMRPCGRGLWAWHQKTHQRRKGPEGRRGRTRRPKFLIFKVLQVDTVGVTALGTPRPCVNPTTPRQLLQQLVRVHRQSGTVEPRNTHSQKHGDLRLEPHPSRSCGRTHAIAVALPLKLAVPLNEKTCASCT